MCGCEGFAMIYMPSQSNQRRYYKAMQQQQNNILHIL